ncbi:hypothetical protein [Labilibaculum euxinus]|uniref:Macroglobulin domain-containing protein n=1 Tax=Labilibaculum euxinus TaxID=2686357 RepID=A0A7M4D4N5_9BACT|nr:hypothetical protein [Labilibaculum euxinus]MUP37614.1 hypothetical protein [Labilibaculum euxinus]MVB06819.1 hypothetical protein [Labilibaculum euxinus]
MKNKNYIYILLILTVSLAINFAGKGENISHESERIHVHIQKNIFLAGESVLLKLYCINSVTQKLSDLSKVAYLELIDENGYAVAQEKIILNQGMGAGGFLITDQLSTGNYAINAYTHWMNSTSKELTSVTPIFVFNNYKLAENSIDNQKITNGSTQFYDLKDNDRTVLRTKSDTNEEKPYTITSSVEDLDRYIRFTVSSNNASSVPDKGLKFQIFSNKGNVVDQSFKLTNNNWEFRIHKKELNSPSYGICVKNPDGEILTEAVFHLASNNKGVFFENPRITVSPREKVQLNLTSKDFTKKAELLYLSASIKLKEPFHTSANIIEFFNIYSNFGASMSSYFEQLSKIPEQDWISKDGLKSLYLHSNPNYFVNSSQYPEEEAYILEGQIKSRKTKEAIANKNVYLSKIGEYADISTFRTHQDGKFFFQLPLKKGLHDISIQLNDNNFEECSIQLKEKFNQKGFASVQWKKSDLNQDQIDFLKKLYENYRIRTIYNQKTYTELKDTCLYRGESNFFGKPYSSTKIDNFIRLDSLEEYFHEFISPVKISYRKKETFFNVYSPDQLKVMKPAPLILYDGLIVSNPRIILNKRPSEIDRIEVMPYEYFYGKSHFYGIIHVISKDKDCKIDQLPINTERYYLPLFTSSYSLANKPSSSDKFMPDFRTDLLWEPNITLGKEQDFKLEFTASDVKGEYELIVEGISENGEPIVLKQSIFIK